MDAKRITDNSQYRSDLTRFRIEMAGRIFGKALDIGGGIGTYLPYFGTDDVCVVDISKEALDQLDWDDKIVADACNLPFENDMFDCVWACSCVMFMDLDKFLDEMKRVLKKNEQSVILIELPNPDSIWNKIKGLFRMKRWEDNEIPGFHMYTIDKMRQLGKCRGEVRFLPKLLDEAIRNKPFWWHTFICEVKPFVEK